MTLNVNPNLIKTNNNSPIELAVVIAHGNGKR